MRGIALLVLPLAVACSAGDADRNGNRPAAEPDIGATRDGACPRPGDDQNCTDLLPAERMRGIWISGFERSWFVPGAVTIPDPNRTDLSDTWLTFAPDARPDPALRREMDGQRGIAVVAIEFDGRRSREAGQFGHMGAADHLVIVERIISARLIGPLPRR